MSATFPSIKPASRQFTGGLFPTKIYRSLAGTAFKRSFGNKPGNFRMTLVFRNIKDAQTSEILNHYYETGAGFRRFALPSQVFAGMSDNLAALAKQSDLIRWEYENPPEVESVYNGISNVTVNLAGEINV
jgi:hypothetical protein